MKLHSDEKNSLYEIKYYLGNFDVSWFSLNIY